MALVLATMALTGGVLAAPAGADPSPTLALAVSSARGAAQCGPLRYDPQVEHAAEIINRSTYDYLQHTAQDVPADSSNPIAIVKDLGIAASKAHALQGAGHNLADAIKGALLQGYNVLPDCAYAEYGVSVLQEDQSDYTLTAVVLVGP